MDTQKIRIELHSPVGTAIYVDDVFQENVVSFELSHAVGGLPKLVLRSHHCEGEIVGQAEVQRIAVCPSCKAERGHRAGVIAETTGLGDAWVRQEAL